MLTVCHLVFVYLVMGENNPKLLILTVLKAGVSLIHNIYLYKWATFGENIE